MPIAIWTKDRLAELFGPDFENILSAPPGRGPLDAEAKKHLLARFAAGIRSNRLKITNVLTKEYLQAGVKLILSKERLSQYMTTGKDPEGLGKDMEEGLRGSIDDGDTLALVAEMAEETIKRL
jgi:hypothetical protein